MHLIIIEPNAHNPGHYTEELFQFSKHIIKYFDSISILTPFGFKEEWNIINCSVYKLCSKLIKEENNPDIISNFIYGYQWVFFKLVKDFMANLSFTDTVVHIWDYKSFFPVWFFLNNCKYKIIINLKIVNREQITFGSRFIGNMRGWLSKELLCRLGDKYIVHTQQIFNEAIKIGIPERKIYLIGVGVGTDFNSLDKLHSRQELNLPLGSFIILFFGVIRKEKGIYEILEHMKSIPENILLFIVGENNLADSLQKLIKAYELESKIITQSNYIPEKEVEKYFRASDSIIICHQRHFKGESGVLLKAIQYEVPVIADLENHAAKIIESDKIGAVFNLFKPGDILNAIRTIRENSKNIEINLKDLKKRKSWNEITKLFYQIYYE